MCLSGENGRQNRIFQIAPVQVQNEPVQVPTSTRANVINESAHGICPLFFEICHIVSFFHLCYNKSNVNSAACKGVDKVRQKFVYKICFMFVIIMLAGFVVFSVTIIQKYAQDIADTRNTYEKELLEKRADKINERLIQIGNVFSDAYLLDDDRNSLAGQIINGTDASDEKKILEYLQNSVNNSVYISDVILLDLQNDKMYSKSRRFYKELDKEYDWMNNEFVQQVILSDGICLQPAHMSSEFDLEEEVYTFGLRIRNSSFLEDSRVYGVILVNVLAENFFLTTSTDASANDEENFIILDQKQQIIYGNKTEKENKLAAERYLDNDSSGYDFTRFKMVSWSGLTCVSLVDTNRIFHASLRTVMKIVLPVLGFIFTGCLLVSVISTKILSKRIESIVQYIKVLEQGHFDQTVEIKNSDEIAIIEKTLNKMSARLSNYIEKEYITDLAIKKAEIQSLQLQINPHFMFNTLEEIRSLAVIEHSEKTARMITLLGQMYRWNINKNNQVKLREELDYLEYYVNLREINLQKDVNIEWNVSKRYYNVSIPKLTLQPIVENSLLHGYKNDDSDFFIEICAYEENEKCMISLTDSGNGMEESEILILQKKIDSMEETEKIYHIGLANVNQRIKLLYGREYGIKIQKSREKNGLQVIVVLPLRWEE